MYCPLLRIFGTNRNDLEENYLTSNILRVRSPYWRVQTIEIDPGRVSIRNPGNAMLATGVSAFRQCSYPAPGNVPNIESYVDRSRQRKRDLRFGVEWIGEVLFQRKLIGQLSVQVFSGINLPYCQCPRRKTEVTALYPKCPIASEFFTGSLTPAGDR